MKISFKLSIFSILMIAMAFSSCSKTESYSDLLKKEQKVSNWFLAQHTVCNDVPADSIFLVGSDAPFYRMDDDGYVYMQVIKDGDRSFPSTGDQVYFTYTRYNIETMYNHNTLHISGEGNQQDFVNGVGDTFFIYNNYSVISSNTFGSGMQIPISYLGYNSEVNILLKSYYGFAADNTTCIPYLVNVRYFKAEY